jgi:hypothetical protein
MHVSPSRSLIAVINTNSAMCGSVRPVYIKTKSSTGLGPGHGNYFRFTNILYFSPLLTNTYRSSRSESITIHGIGLWRNSRYSSHPRRRHLASSAPKILKYSTTLSTTRWSSQAIPNQYAPANPRQSPRHRTSDTQTDVDDLFWTKEAYFSCKGWRGGLSTGQMVFAKLWDGWKISREKFRKNHFVHAVNRAGVAMSLGVS